VCEEVEIEGTDCSDRFPAFSARFSSYKYPEGFKPIGITKYDGKQAPQQWLRCYSTAIEVVGGSNITKVSTSRWLWTLRRSRGWRASTTTRSTPGNCSRRSSSTTSKGRSLVQVLVTILSNVNRNVTSSYGPIYTVSSMSAPPLRISRRTSSTASTMASPTQASTETSGGTGQKRLRGFMTRCTTGQSRRRRCGSDSRGAMIAI
jgi:hypothetical protein